MPNHLPTPDYPRFHLAFPVTDLAEARRFYGDFLGCAEGRSSDEWVDFDFFGHQIVAHKVAASAMSAAGPSQGANSVPPGGSAAAKLQARGNPAVDATSDVDGKQVPVRHFGIVTDRATWDALAHRLRAAHVRFIIDPYVRFEGEPGEQATMFLLDPFGNALEFKAFADMNQLFATS
jgi:extradiol dioxygenase family protein